MHTKYITHNGTYGIKMHGISTAYMHKANMSRAYNWRTCIRRTKFMCLKFKEYLKNNWKPYDRRPCEEGGSVIAHLVAKLAAIVESYTMED